MNKTGLLAAAFCVLSAVTTRGDAAVLFENPGTLTGWSKVYVQQQGTNTLVSTPTFQGPTAIKSTQTFIIADGRGYHSERVMFDIQKNGEDRYYGMALYLPPDWVFHDQNVTFQQWATENPGGGGPWILMFVQNDKLKMGGSGASGSRELATITNLRGTWIRIVTRINMTATGPFEVWVNGIKSPSAPINLLVGGDPPTIRWSTGMYCTAWRTQQPAGGSPISVWHDHLRVATTYSEAEPANWTEGPLVDGGATDVPPMVDAASSDADSPDVADSDASAGDTPGAEAGGSGGAGTGGAAGATGGGGSGGKAGATGGKGGAGAAGSPAAPASDQSGCGCAVGGRSPAPSSPALLVLLFAAAVFARRRAIQLVA
jgi:MYXO-CTERM domain-containing protein